MERPSAAENGDLGEFSVVDVVQDRAGREPGCYRCVGGGGGAMGAGPWSCWAPSSYGPNYWSALMC